MVDDDRVSGGGGAVVIVADSLSNGRYSTSLLSNMDTSPELGEDRGVVRKRMSGPSVEKLAVFVAIARTL